MLLKTFHQSSKNPVGEVRSPDEAEIRRAVYELDWSREEISTVVVERDCDHWADLSGSLSSNIGLSLMVREGHAEHVSLSPPEGLEEGIGFLVAYSMGDTKAVYETLFEKTMQQSEIEMMNRDINYKSEREQLGLALGCLAILVAVIFFAVMAFLFPGGL